VEPFGACLPAGHCDPDAGPKAAQMLSVINIRPKKPEQIAIFPVTGQHPGISNYRRGHFSWGLFVSDFLHRHLTGYHL
jgi:hypothetical protein